MVEKVAILSQYQGFFAFLCGKSIWSHLAYVVVHRRFYANNGGSMKSTPAVDYRAWFYAHACQGNFPNDASHDRRVKRVRACSSYGETIHDRRASKACACMDKDLKIDRSICP